MRIPARQLHLKWAGPHTRCVNGCRDASIEATRSLLHHDHLANYALCILHRRLGGRNHPDAGRLFQKIAPLLRDHLRFPPAWVCAACNEGDGRGKDPAYMKRGSALYPECFSMNPSELARVRGKKGQAWLLEAEQIWSDAAADLRTCRIRIHRLVIDHLPQRHPRSAPTRLDSPSLPADGEGRASQRADAG